MVTAEQVIQQTSNWVDQVVAACNFCPFVSREIQRDAIHYQVEFSVNPSQCLQSFLIECKRLDEIPATTTLLIFPNAFEQFDEYLALVSLAEKLLRKNDYEGIYQVASFHPQYVFAGSPPEDPANYTNRSIYPMLHLLREDSIEQALLHYPHPEQIPERNIHFTRSKGLTYMKLLRDSCI